MAKTLSPYIYKLFLMNEWRDFEKSGVFHGAPIDLTDGYIHFSSAEYVKSTAEKYFAQENPLIVAKIDVMKLPAEIIWEPARGGILFPHLYDILPLTAVTDFDVMARDEQEQLNWPNWLFD